MKRIIFLISSLAICLFWFTLIYEPKQTSSIDTNTTQQILTTYEQKDITKIQQEIKKSESLMNIESTRTLSQRFSNTVIVGDSMVHALKDYQALPSKNLAGEIGKRTDNIYDQVDIALKRKPDHIFLFLGLNDLSTYKKRFTMFEERYQEVIDYIHKKDKHVNIHLNSLIPLPKETIKKYGEYQYIDDYNQVIQSLCKKNHLIYIDNTTLLEPKMKHFESDGTHPKYPFYPKWLKNMADTILLE